MQKTTWAKARNEGETESASPCLGLAVNSWRIRLLYPPSNAFNHMEDCRADEQPSSHSYNVCRSDRVVVWIASGSTASAFDRRMSCEASR